MRTKGGFRARNALGGALALTVALTAMIGSSPGTSRAQAAAPGVLQPSANQGLQMGSAQVPTTTPIKHLIVVIGENHSFDNVFATYQPPHGQHIWNLLSEGIVTKSGALGPRASLAAQRIAVDHSTYQTAPPKVATYGHLPQPNTTYVAPACDGNQLPNTPDSRFPAALPNAPFQITKYVPYFATEPGCPVTGAVVGDPLHRFYQMWQQTDHGRNDLFTWTANTAGDANGKTPPPPIAQGAVQMGYYNMAAGDAPTFNYLAQHYAISDNYHQAVMGGTGANHVAIGTASVAYYTAGAKHRPAVPPANQIENPNPLPGANNAFTQDGYSGGSYTNCSDPTAPGVSSIMNYLHSLPYPVFRGGNCAPGHYYMLNNLTPAYTPTGQPTVAGQPYVVPPQTLPTIANSLSAHGISWGYFGQGWNNGAPTPAYCSICDPFQYESSIMTTSLRANLQGFTQFQQRVANGTLPAVSFVKPGDAPPFANDGHPGYSSLAAFEGFTRTVVNDVMAKPSLWRSTAILVTTDEGGGYYDSGYIQHVDYFGDGTRVPMIAISPYARVGHVSHTYQDHASILKFIEANWGLAPLSSRSIDNLPNPITRRGNPYVPVNQPAIGNLMSLFSFSQRPHRAKPIPALG